MTTRQGGRSVAPWDSFNLGAMVGDSAAAVAANRRHLADLMGAQPVWLRQVHGCHVLRVSASDASNDAAAADAAWTSQPGVACAVLVADCLPVLLAAPTAVAAAHAGWRGLAAGVLENTVQALCSGSGSAPDAVVAWLGPCIGPRQFEVGADVLQAFKGSPDQGAAAGFVSQGVRDGAPRWLADLQGLAHQCLRRAGVQRISAAQRCTVEERSDFFSYRRDGVCGRMAAAVWLRS
jgi:YfiH family protein